MGLVAPQNVGSSWARARTRVPALAGGFLTTVPPGKPYILLRESFQVHIPSQPSLYPMSPGMTIWHLFSKLYPEYFFSSFPLWPILPTSQVMQNLINCYCINYIPRLVTPPSSVYPLSNSICIFLIHLSSYFSGSLKSSIIYWKRLILAFKAFVVDSVDAPSQIFSAILSSPESTGGHSSQPVVKFSSRAPVFLLLSLRDFPSNLGVRLAACSSNPEVWCCSKLYSSILIQCGMRLQR